MKRMRLAVITLVIGSFVALPALAVNPAGSCCVDIVHSEKTGCCYRVYYWDTNRSGSYEPFEPVARVVLLGFHRH